MERVIDMTILSDYVDVLKLTSQAGFLQRLTIAGPLGSGSI